VTTTHTSKFTDMELRQVGIALLLENLGYAETLRFLSQLSPGQGDYLLWRNQLFAESSIDDIFERAKEHFDEGRNPNRST